MSGSDYGKSTGQHEQPRQQAELYESCTRGAESIQPVPYVPPEVERFCEDHNVVYMTDECPECHDEYLRDLAGDEAFEGGIE